MDGKRFCRKTNQELVDSFNREVNSNASASARFEYIILLVDEFKNRGIDVSFITGDNNSIKLSRKITIVENKLEEIHQKNKSK